MAEERPCCVWCKATMVRGLRARKQSATQLCIKCTLWALTGQTPPYVPPRRQLVSPPQLPPAAHARPAVSAW